MSQASTTSAEADFDDASRRRLRWRARRGLLENDLILARFFERDAGAPRIDDVAALDSLLDLPDNELLDLLLGRKQLDAALDRPDVQSLLARLRAA